MNILKYDKLRKYR